MITILNKIITFCSVINENIKIQRIITNDYGKEY